MGLDLALGVVVLLGAIRGWLKGFVLQATRLAGLVACVYAADPVRDVVKPYVVPHLPSIRPELIDRLIWWVAAATCYVVIVGLATSIYKLSQRQAFGIGEPRRNDQYAGFALGAAKGLIVAVFLVSALERYAVQRVKGIAWAEEQVHSSKVIKWNDQYQPAARIWASPPVRHFVDHVQRMGLKHPEPGSVPAEGKPLQAASTRAPRLLVPIPELDTSKAIGTIKDELGRVGSALAPAN